MATYGRWNRTIADDAGNIVNATVSVYRESDGVLATIYSGRTGGAKANPFTLSNSDKGLAFFYAAGGPYKIVASRGSWSQTWRHEAVGTAGEYDVESFIGTGQAPSVVFSRTDLKALSTSSAKFAALNEGGRSGEFVFLYGDYSAQVAADTVEIAFIKATDTAASSGAWVRVYAESINVKWAGAVGDGSTDDKAAIQAALDLVKALGGGALFFPRGNGYKLSAGLTYNISAEASRFSKRLRLIGEGAGASYLTMTGVAAALFTYTGNASYVESYLDIEGLRFTGDNTSGSKGLVVNVAAFMHTNDFVAEAFDYCSDMTDVEQATFENSNWRWGLHGLRFNAASAATSANSLNFINCAISNNTTWGAEFTNPNAVQFLGGSVQYNGSAGGGSTQWGIKTIEAGNGYGTVEFIGVAFEGNGGLGDHVSSQSSYIATHAYIGCGFARPSSSNYATNCITCLGSTASSYTLDGCTLRGYGTYVANAGRPYIALTNTAALFFDRGNNIYGSATEQPSWAGYARVPAKMTVGAGGAAIGTLAAHAATDQNFYAAGKANLADGVKIGSVNDANDAAKGLELDGSSILLSIAGTGKALLSSTALAPNTSDGLALGTASLMWSDLFLASGAVLNFANGDVTITHSADALAFAGAATLYSFDGSVLVGGGNKIGVLTAHAATDKNFYVAASFSLSDGIAFGSINDANNALKGMEFRASRILMTGSFGRGAPITKTGDFTLAEGENNIIVNKGSTCTVTLGAASAFSGREITLKTIQAQTVVSASANVVPLAGGAAGTAILAAAAGKWATLISDGTNWIILKAA